MKIGGNGIPILQVSQNAPSFPNLRHTERVDKEDGSNRTRVRFNIEGQYGGAFVFAEVSSAMPSGEFVYGKP